MLLKLLFPAVLLCSFVLPAGAGTLAQFRTVFGDVDVELYDQDKPITVQNFIHYVTSGAYQNMFSHRLVPGFVVQGGGFTIINRGTTNWDYAAVQTPANGIPNEFAVGPRLSNKYGTIAMAKRGGDTNSATSQWFINLADNTFLDAADTNNLFVVFGRVLRGTNVLNTLNRFSYWSGTQKSNLIANVGGVLSELPLLSPVLSDTNHLFIDISLLNIQVSRNLSGSSLISWNSVSNKLNQVEFTTDFPPTWQLLVSTNGNGARYTVEDPLPVARRFYRVRAIY